MRLALKGNALNAATHKESIHDVDDDDDDYDDVNGNNKRRVNRISLHVTHVQNPIYKVHAIFNFPQFSLDADFLLLLFLL